MKPYRLCRMAILAAALPLAAIANGWSTDELKQLQHMQNTVQPPDISAKALHEQSKQWQSMATQLQQGAMDKLKRQTKNPEATAAGMMIFASLGMPDNSLQQLMAQAAKHDVPIVIRGLWNNDFAQTAQRVQQFILPKEGEPILGGVEINPVWFKQFGITQVPAFVVIAPDKCQGKPPCDVADFDVLYGNVSLYDALDILQREGTHHAVAKTVANR